MLPGASILTFLTSLEPASLKLWWNVVSVDNNNIGIASLTKQNVCWLFCCSNCFISWNHTASLVAVTFLSILLPNKLVFVNKNPFLKCRIILLQHIWSAQFHVFRMFSKPRSAILAPLSNMWLSNYTISNLVTLTWQLVLPGKLSFGETRGSLAVFALLMNCGFRQAYPKTEH